MRSRRGIYYVDTGEGPASPILMIHGWGASHRYYEEVTEHLQDHRCISVDLPGFGQSRDAEEGGASIKRFADDTRDLITELDIEPVVCGHSMGGMISQEVALRWQDSLRGLVLIGTTSLPHLNRSWRLLIRISPLLYPLMIKRGMKWFARHFAVNEASTPRRSLELLDEIVVDNRRRWLRKCVYGMKDWRSYGLLKDLEVPALVIHGELDRMIDPGEGESLSDQLGCGFVKMKGVGHSPTIERPSDTARIIADFVNGLNTS